MIKPAGGTPALVTLTESSDELRMSVAAAMLAPQHRVTITPVTDQPITAEILQVRFRGNNRAQSVKLSNETSIIIVHFPKVANDPLLAEVYDFTIKPDLSVNPDG